MAQLSTKLPLELMQTKWGSALNPILALPILSGIQLNNISLTANTALVINHLLSRLPQGWFLVDNTANTVIWRTQPYNTSTITLESAANTVISIWVY